MVSWLHTLIFYLCTLGEGYSQCDPTFAPTLVAEGPFSLLLGDCVHMWGLVFNFLSLPLLFGRGGSPQTAPYLSPCLLCCTSLLPLVARVEGTRKVAHNLTKLEEAHLVVGKVGQSERQSHDCHAIAM